MPLMRFHGMERRVRRALRRGEVPVTENTDMQHFRHPPTCMDPDGVKASVLDAPRYLGIQDGDVLVFGWRPVMSIIGGLGLFVFIWGWLALWGYMRGEPGTWGTEAAVCIPLGFWMLIWYPFLARHRHLVVFDRRRGLVHLPGLWGGRRPDAVRFEDLGVLIQEETTGYMGMYRSTVVYAVRPPWSLWCSEHPPWYARVWFIIGGHYKHDAHDGEESWRRIATFMTEPLKASPWVAARERMMASVITHEFGGDALGLRRVDSRTFLNFYKTELLTEPNWVYDAEGRWVRRPEGPRERLRPTDGPASERVPVDEPAGFLDRLKRRLGWAQG